MATQIFKTGTYEYIVIDNKAAPTFPTLSVQTHIGYDTTSGGESTQDTNPYTAGTIPDCVNRSTTILNTRGTSSLRLLYLNPA